MAENSFMRESGKEKEKITVCVGAPEDARAIQEVTYKAWLRVYPNEELGITEEDIHERFRVRLSDEYIQKRAEQLANSPEGEATLVAKDKDKVIGFCRVSQKPEKNQLNAIYLLPEYQGKGVGSLLWKEAQKYFDQKKKTTVEVVSYNSQAINFYKSLGFQDTGRRWQDEAFRMKSGAALPEMELAIPIKEVI